MNSIVMRHFLLAATFAFSPSNTYLLIHQTAYTGGAVTTGLKDLRDQYRPLLVFAASDRDAKFIEQVHLISEGASQLHERQVIFIPIVGTGDTGTTQTETGETGPWVKPIDPELTAQLSTDDAAKARQRYHVSPFDFTVILIGKDGGEKFRTHNPVTMKRLNTVIDAMPMRQQEIRDGHAN